MELNGKRVLVYGTGKSGIGAADLLTAKGAVPVLFDEKKADAAAVGKKLENPEKAEFLLGADLLTEEVIRGLDLAVMSPGVPLDIPNVERFRKAGIPVIGEVELAYLAGRGTVYAITGTNGKTTTTSLLGKIMSDYDPNTFIVGNIGTAWTTVAAKTDDSSRIVAEISSFQLETADTFHAHVSSILNITEDHLNRHHTMEEYTRVKELVTLHQDRNDFCVLNYEDARLRAFGEALEDRTQVVWFSSARPVEGGMWLQDGDIMTDLNGIGKLIGVKEAKIIGVHNYENIMAAAAMAVCAGIPVENIRASIRDFTAVPHRIEFVREVGGVIYYNDSKGTNPDAAIKGIEAMERPTLLIGGGYDKGSDYKPWIRAFGGKVKYLVLEGATREAIREAALSCGFPEDRIIMRETMDEALTFCIENAEPGDAVLLSPACASWGEFENYECRGEAFKARVAGIKD